MGEDENNKRENDDGYYYAAKGYAPNAPLAEPAYYSVALYFFGAIRASFHFVYPVRLSSRELRRFPFFIFMPDTENFFRRIRVNLYCLLSILFMMPLQFLIGKISLVLYHKSTDGNNN